MACFRMIATAMTALCCVMAARPVSAQSPAQSEDLFKGKTVRLVVGYAPGGGYDIYARMIAPYIGKALGTSVVVENQPGAGGITALNRIMAGPNDGLQFMLVNGLGASLGQLTNQTGVRYDLAKLAHLGTVSASPWMWLTGSKSTLDTPKKALDAKRPLNWAAGGPMDGLSDGAAFTCAALKAACSIVLGYPGSNEAALAVGRGEMDMIYVSDTSANNYVKAGQNKPVAAMGRAKSRFFPDVPTIFDVLSVSPEGAQLLDYHSTAENLGRILVAPPATTPERLAALQAAVKAALNDKALIAEGERTQRYVDFIGAEETRQATIHVVADVSPDQKTRILEILASIERK